MARQNLKLSTSGSHSSLVESSESKAAVAKAAGEEASSDARADRRKTEGVLNYVASIMKRGSSLLMSQKSTSGKNGRRHTIAPEIGTDGGSDAIDNVAAVAAVDFYEPSESASKVESSSSSNSSCNDGSDSDDTDGNEQPNENSSSNGPGAAEEPVSSSSSSNGDGDGDNSNDKNNASVSNAGTEGTAAGATLLLAFSQGANSDIYSQLLTEEDEEQGESLQSTLVDVTVLEHMSQRIIDTVCKMEQQMNMETAFVATDALRQLNGLAREQVLVRQQHFTRNLFIENAQRPSDAADMVQWAVALQRANLATFALLVFCPQVVVIESVARGVPNRERLLGSLGFADAAREFFKHVVPVSRRDDAAIGLLVDMQTQQWLMAASGETHLQAMIAEERDADSAAVHELLALDQSVQKDPGPTPSFDNAGPAMYRAELSRRLDRLSGGRLADTCAQYPVQAVWRRVAQFVSECNTTLTVPTLMDSALVALQGGESFDSEASAYEEEGGENISSEMSVHEEESSDASASDPSAVSDNSMISGDFEITVFKERRPAINSDAAPATSQESPLSDTGVGVDEGLAAVVDDVAPIDPSFLEVRRVAVVMRDVLTDAHLESLLQEISAENIDIGEPSAQTQTPRRMRVAHRQTVLAQADNGDDFQLRFDEQDPDTFEAKDAMPSTEADMDADNSSGHSRSRRRLRRGQSRRKSHDSPDPLDGATEELARQFASTLRRPAGRISYNPQAEAAQSGTGEFRGRRGIAAEDLSVLQGADSEERVAFTPSVAGSPAPEDSVSNGENDDETVGLGALGQYKPLALKPTATDSEYRETQQHKPSRSRTKRKRKGASTTQVAKMQKGSSVRKATLRWTTEEEECFVHAVFQHGLHWSLILRHHGANGVDDHVLRNRNRFNLKDKARNIKLRLLREGKPLGPFAGATGHL
ncbi:TTAGGG repeat binding factor [Coemansia sp. RSA 1365]|nr:TTAGGG repeat binding factor [Coemansia sp. RSA 1365]